MSFVAAEAVLVFVADTVDTFDDFAAEPVVVPVSEHEAKVDIIKALSIAQNSFFIVTLLFYFFRVALSAALLQGRFRRRGDKQRDLEVAVAAPELVDEALHIVLVFEFNVVDQLVETAHI